MVRKLVVVFLSIVFIQALAFSIGQDPFAQVQALLPSEAAKADSIASSLYSQAVLSDNPEQIAKASYWLGLTNHFTGRLYISTEYFRKALESRYIQDNLPQKSSCWNNIGINYELLGQIDAALEAYQESYQIAQAMNDSTSIAQSWINLGLLEAKQQHLKEAGNYFESARDYFSSTSDSLNLGLAIQNMGVVARLESDWDALFKYSQQALSVHQQVGNAHSMTECLVNMGFAAMQRGDLLLSDTLLRQALELSVDKGFQIQKATALRNLGALYTRRGSTRLAIEYLKEAVAIYEANGFFEPIGSTYLDLLKAIAFSGDLDQYAKVMEDLLDSEQIRLQTAASNRYEELKAIYEHDRQMLQINQQESQIRLQETKFQYLVILALVLLIASLWIFKLLVEAKGLQKALFQKNSALTQQLSVHIRKQNEDLRNASQQHSKFKELFQDIEEIVDARQLYKDTDLSLTKLSQLLNSNESYVSKAINSFSGLNFNQYLNRYRTRIAQRLLVEKTGDSVREIAVECGFNSYSTFNRIFKQNTGLTPGQYQQQAISSKEHAVMDDEDL